MVDVNCDNIGCTRCVNGVCVAVVVNMAVDDKTGFSMCTNYKPTRKDDICWTGM